MCCESMNGQHEMHPTAVSAPRSFSGTPEKEPLDDRVKNMRVVYSPGKYKKYTCEKLELLVDVWVDDNPGIIQPGAF